MENFEHDFNWRLERETTRMNYNSFHPKHHNGYRGQFNKRRVMDNSPRSSKIVVLKPNTGKFSKVLELNHHLVIRIVFCQNMEIMLNFQISDLEILHCIKK